jgi:serine/threonine protein kinase
MAPEVILEEGHDQLCDIWSLGITLIEIAEGKPPYFSLNPMRAIFVIPTRAPPTFADTTEASVELREFLARCLTRNSNDRATADQLLALPVMADERARRYDLVRDLLKTAADGQKKNEARKLQMFNQFKNAAVDIASGSNATDADDGRVLNNEGSGRRNPNSNMHSLRRRPSSRALRDSRC